MTAITAKARTGLARQDARLIGLVGVSHLISHFSQLLLAPLFPWLKVAFAIGYAELGLLMTIFFVVTRPTTRCSTARSIRHGSATPSACTASPAV